MRIAELPLVPRPRLIARLQSGSIGLVEAGAGYGKSVLASQYRQALGIATAYVPLGPPDRDPSVLIGSLRRALAGETSIRVRLTAAGRRLLERSRRLATTSTSRFIPSGGKATSISSIFTLKR